MNSILIEIFYSASSSFLHVRFNQKWKNRKRKSKNDTQHTRTHLRRSGTGCTFISGGHRRYNKIQGFGEKQFLPVRYLKQCFV